MKLSDAVLKIPHSNKSDTRNEVSYRMAWARTYLKKCNIVENSSRGIWSLRKTTEYKFPLDPAQIVREVRNIQLNTKVDVLDKKEKNLEILDDEELEPWRNEIKQTLLELDPSAFERLTQRILREAGFIQVEVTGRSGDGGIDGKGILRLNHLVSFHMIFQCKRYSKSVTSTEIRNFRGSMQGRAEKGLFVTTGYFTRDAQREASRDGAPPIDLVDGEQLVEMLKNFELGVVPITKIVYQVNKKWFEEV